jgi:hypothetical protein
LPKQQGKNFPRSVLLTFLQFEIAGGFITIT